MKVPLVTTADGLATFPRLGVLHLAIAIESIHEFLPRRLPCQLEGTAHAGDTKLGVGSGLGATCMLATGSLVVQDPVHQRLAATAATRHDASTGVRGAAVTTTLIRADWAAGSPSEGATGSVRTSYLEG